MPGSVSLQHHPQPCAGPAATAPVLPESSPGKRSQELGSRAADTRTRTGGSSTSTAACKDGAGPAVPQHSTARRGTKPGARCWWQGAAGQGPGTARAQAVWGAHAPHQGPGWGYMPQDPAGAVRGSHGESGAKGLCAAATTGHVASPPCSVRSGLWELHRSGQSRGGPSSMAAGGQSCARGPGSHRVSTASGAGAGGSQPVSLHLCREAGHLPARQPGDPHAGRLHEPVQDRLQLRRQPEVLQEWLRQGLLLDAPPLRSVGRLGTPAAPPARHPHARPAHDPLLPSQEQPPPASPATGKLLRVLHAQSLAPHRHPPEPSASAASQGPQ